MRLFTAIDLTGEARSAIGAEQARIRHAMAHQDRALRWVRPEHMHLTLVFLGEVADADVAAATEAMAGELNLAPFTVVFGGLGTFPPDRPPRVLWIGVAQGGRETIELERVVRKRLADAGLSVDNRPYHPHLTLARWRESRGADRRIVAGGPPVVASVPVRAATLYESRLGPDGPTYVPRAGLVLRAPADTTG
jgi:2'-5' RNA ligase